MKYLLTGFLSFFSLFGFYTQDNADFNLSKFLYNDNEQIIMTLQIKSDNVMALEQTLTYDDSIFELEDVQANKYFTATIGEKKKVNGLTQVKLLFDSEYAFRSVEYAQLTFKAKGEKGIITIDDIYSSDLNNNLNHSYGEEYTVELKNEKINILKKELSLQNQINMFAQKNKTLLITICVVLVAIMVIKNIAQSIIYHRRKNKIPFREVSEQTMNIIQNNTVQPQYFKDPEALSKTEIKKLEAIQGAEDLQEIEDKEDSEPISDDIFKGKYEVFIILLLVSSILFTTSVFARSEETVQTIRDAIVNEKYDRTVDMNSDNVINVVDLVYAIGTEDVQNKGVINFKAEEKSERTTAPAEYATTEPQQGMEHMMDNVR